MHNEPCRTHPLSIMAPALHVIELEESERIVRYGVTKQIWMVHLEGRWIPIRLVPNAEIAQRQPRPGYVWARSVTVKLPEGTRLEHVQESPRPRTPTDAFDILTLDQKSSTVRRTTPHEVRDGRVAPRKR